MTEIAFARDMVFEVKRELKKAISEIYGEVPDWKFQFSISGLELTAKFFPHGDTSDNPHSHWKYIASDSTPSESDHGNADDACIKVTSMMKEDGTINIFMYSEDRYEMRIMPSDSDAAAAIADHMEMEMQNVLEPMLPEEFEMTYQEDEEDWVETESGWRKSIPLPNGAGTFKLEFEKEEIEAMQGEEA